MTVRTVLTIAGLTLREASRRRVLFALAGLTIALLALSAWGFSRLAAESGFATLTSGQARLVASQLLNLVMFGLSLIAALGTAFLGGPTVAGEIESGIALAVLARPVRRSRRQAPDHVHRRGVLRLGALHLLKGGTGQFGPGRAPVVRAVQLDAEMPQLQGGVEGAVESPPPSTTSRARA